MTLTKEHTHEAFFIALQTQDALGALIRAHFQIEAHLQRVLTRDLQGAEGLPTLITSLSYEQKVRLTVALGMHPRVLQPLVLLGQLRDAAVKSPEPGLSDAALEQLFGLLAKPEREAVLAWHGKCTAGVPFRQAQPLQRFNVIATVLHAFMAAEDAARGDHSTDEPDEVVTFEWSAPAPARHVRDFASREALYSWLIASD